MAAEHDDPGEGSGRRPHPDAPGTAATVTEPRAARSSGKVRAARLTDLAALGELSRLCQSDGADTRSLGLPLSGPPIGVFSLFRLPLGAFRPNDLMYVYEQDGRIAGLVRVERESVRDEWTIVELDAVGMADAGDIRYRLVQQLLREGAKRGAARFHVACADMDGNVELLMQAGFMRYGEERILARPGSEAHAGALVRQAGGAGGDPAGDRHRRARAVAAVRRRHPGAGRPARGDPPADWERQGSHWRVPRSSLAPILRFADVEAFVQAMPGRRAVTARSSPASSRSASPRRTSRTTCKVVARPDADASALVAFGLGVIAERTAKGADRRTEHGVIAPVRTYESPIDRRLEEAGFDSIASVTLLMKETLVRVAEPALVPAGVR